MTIPALEFSHVTLSRGGHDVLRDVSFKIPQGSFVGVLGANGAGKTTLFRGILGLEAPGAGTILFEGRKVRRGNSAAGYMPQMRNMPGGQLSGLSMVEAAYRGQVPGLPWGGHKRRAAAEAALAAVDALSLAHRPVATLSGGQRQRLLLAQVLLDDPSLLLLDEPMASLDPARMSDTVTRIHTLARKRNMTVLLSAHDINPLLGFMDYVLYLAGGKALLGPVREVITSETLTALYGAPVEVLKVGQRLFVVAEGGGGLFQSHDCTGHHHNASL